MRNGLIVWDIEEIIMFINRKKRSKKPTKTFLYYFYNVFASALSGGYNFCVFFFCFLVDN